MLKSKHEKDPIYFLNTLVSKIFFKEINTFIQQGNNKFIKNDSNHN